MTGTVSAEIPVSADSRPRHVAIIMDGNNRWAKARRLKGVAGHKAGVDAVKSVVETCAREGVEVLTNEIRLRIIGDRSAFTPTLQELMANAEQLTRNNTRMTLVIAANYGGHWDIVQATRQVAEKVKEGLLQPSDITDDLIQQHLSIGDLPLPDLMIRTAGEQRISNFMLWHLAYTELYFSPVFWPDFKQDEMHKALQSYAGRQRRFGQTDDQITATS